MIHPKISIIVPTYNKSAHLARLLPSIIEQDYESEDFEIIIVDDGSKDSTASAAEQFADRFANYQYVYQHNKGIGAARNTGLKHARGELISFIADDYVLDPTYLSKMSSAFADKSIHGVRPLFNTLGRTPVEMAMYINMISGFKKQGGTLINPKIYRFPSVIAWGGASMTRRKVFDDHGPFLVDFATVEDYEYGIRLAQAGIHIHIYNETLFKIKNRTNFIEANLRLYEYGFNNSQLKKYLNHNSQKHLGLMARTVLDKPPLVLRLVRMFGRPLRNSFKYADNHLQAIRILPISYAMLVCAVLGMLHGNLSTKRTEGVSNS